MVPLLVVLALVAGLIGLVGSLLENQFGLGLLAFGGLLAIFARIAQASAHHSAPLEKIKAQEKAEADATFTEEQIRTVRAADYATRVRRFATTPRP